jgi:hypothetical protein
MDLEISTYSTLSNLVEIDNIESKMRPLGVLFLAAMCDWPTMNQEKIVDFVAELKSFFGTPITIGGINGRSVSGGSLWESESGSSIAELIELSSKQYGEADFDKILQNILEYYQIEFTKVDFIAELQYSKTEQGGRKTPAKSGYRPQLKFDFTEMQTSGQQTFIGKEWVSPGEMVDAKIKMLSPNYFAGNLSVGMSFDFRELSIIVGTGVIKEIINDSLEKQS